MDVVVLTLVLPAQAITSSTGCYTATHTLSSFTVHCNTSNSVKARMEICITYTLNVAFFFLFKYSYLQYCISFKCKKKIYIYT